MGAEGAFRAGSGEPLVLIHGLTCVPQVWRPILGDLERSFDVLVVALAGHVGGEPLPDGVPASVAALADAVERDMDAAGLQSAHIAGNSLGGWIALELASRGRARSVVALSPAGGWERGSGQERRLKALFRRNHALSTRMLPYARGLLSRPRLRRAVLSGAMARADRISPSEALEVVEGAVRCPIYFDLMEAIEREGPPSAFPGIACPVLLAWGAKDRILPARGCSQGIRNLVPSAYWMDLPGLGHMPMGDDPELIARVIGDFVAHAGRGADRSAHNGALSYAAAAAQTPA
jgi:pimeloyl-ACP methyl ester carboxylesterase